MIQYTKSKECYVELLHIARHKRYVKLCKGQTKVYGRYFNSYDSATQFFKEIQKNY